MAVIAGGAFPFQPFLVASFAPPRSRLKSSWMGAMVRIATRAIESAFIALLAYQSAIVISSF